MFYARIGLANYSSAHLSEFLDLKNIKFVIEIYSDDKGKNCVGELTVRFKEYLQNPVVGRVLKIKVTSRKTKEPKLANFTKGAIRIAVGKDYHPIDIL